MFNSRMSSKRCVSLNARFGIPIDRTPHASSSDTSRAYRRNRSKMSANLVLAASAARKLNICAKRRSPAPFHRRFPPFDASANLSRINLEPRVQYPKTHPRHVRSRRARASSPSTRRRLWRVNSRSMDSETSRKCFVARARAFEMIEQFERAPRGNATDDSRFPPRARSNVVGDLHAVDCARVRSAQMTNER